jgi:ketosteroid isomerase-like protein
VIAAERAFAARAAEVGVAESFLEFMAADAIVFAPGPVSARALYGARPRGKSPKEGGTRLAWWPNWAGVARSGDLGFTTGPAEVNGQRTVNYFTVWRKRPNGPWRWVFDGGASDASGGAPSEAPVAAMAAGLAGPPQGRAYAQVKAAEVKLARRARSDATAAYRTALAPDAHVQGGPGPPAATPAAVAMELAARPRTLSLAALGGAASRAGDLAWTYGEARWIRPDGQAASGHYVRVWRRGLQGWRIVFDQLQDDVPSPPSKR